MAHQSTLAANPSIQTKKRIEDIEFAGTNTDELSDATDEPNGWPIAFTRIDTRGDAGTNPDHQLPMLIRSENGLRNFTDAVSHKA